MQSLLSNLPLIPTDWGIAVFVLVSVGYLLWKERSKDKEEDSVIIQAAWKSLEAQNERLIDTQRQVLEYIKDLVSKDHEALLRVETLLKEERSKVELATRKLCKLEASVEAAWKRLDCITPNFPECDIRDN